MYNDIFISLLKASGKLEVNSLTDNFADNTPECKSLNSNQGKKYIWRTVGDSKVRSRHASLDGTVRVWGDGLNPGEDYNCRCYPEFLDGVSTNSKKLYNNKQWSELSVQEKEEQKQKALDNFKNSEQLKSNIKKAKQIRDDYNVVSRHFIFKKIVTNFGDWDYKNKQEDGEHIGNFNYGVTAKAIGFPGWELMRMAGWKQKKDGNSKDEWGSPYNLPFTGSSYGDDPIDQYYIKEGIKWYEENYE